MDYTELYMAFEIAKENLELAEMEGSHLEVSQLRMEVEMLTEQLAEAELDE